MQRSKAPGLASRCDVETERLFESLRRGGDPTAREQLIERHSSLVRFLAAKFANRGEPLEDLLQVALIGLIHAVDRFDPARGLRFSTFATPTIVGEIKRHFRDRGWSLKAPRGLRELHHQTTLANEKLSQALGRPPSVEEIAAQVGCSEEEAVQALEMTAIFETVSLDAQLQSEGESPMTLGESIGAEDTVLDHFQSYEDVKRALHALDARERLIVYLRFFQDQSQSEVAQRLHISQMHVSRLQHRALQKLREILTADERPHLQDAA